MFAHGNQPELKDTETLSLAALRKKAPTLTGSECFGMPASMPCDAFTPFD